MRVYATYDMSEYLHRDICDFLLVVALMMITLMMMVVGGDVDSRLSPSFPHLLPFTFLFAFIDYVRPNPLWFWLSLVVDLLACLLDL